VTDKPQGRPSLLPEKKRSQHIVLTVTPSEFEHIKQAASVVGLTVSTFGRRAILAAATVKKRGKQ